MSKYNYNPEKVSRKMFDHRMDQLVSKLVRFGNKQLETNRRVKDIEDFLAMSPHASAFEAYKEKRRQERKAR